MNEEEKRKPRIFDNSDGIETLDDDSDIEESPEEVDGDTSSYEPETSSPYDTHDNSYNQNRNRYRQDEPYHDRQYYKDRVKETGENRQLAKDNANQAMQKRNNAKENYKAARKEDDKDARKQAKSDYKEAKQEAKDAKREYKTAKSNNRLAKYDKFNDSANRAMHPIETGKKYLKNKINEHNPAHKLQEKAREKIDTVKDQAKEKTKEVAKKAGKAAKEGAKKAGKAAGKAAAKTGKVAVEGIAKLIASVPPPVWIVVGIILALLLIAMVVIVVLGNDDDSEELTNISTTTCAYENLGGIGEDTKVKVYSCDGTTEETTISLEQYIAGVAAYDMEGNFDSQASRAYIVVVRSNVLSHAFNGTNNYSYDASTNVIKVNQCPETPFYWNYNSNLYRDATDPAQYSYNETDGYPLYKSALDDKAKASLERCSNEVSCMYLTDENNNVVSVNIDFSTLLSQENANSGTDNGSYTGLLMGTDGVSNVSTGQVHYNSYFSADVGDYAKWKQCDDRWGSIKLGYKNVCSWGCLLVSMSMLVAHSEVPTGDIVGLSPATFVEAMKDAGAVSISGNTSYGKVGNVIPGFSYSYKKEVNNDYKEIEKMANDGCYISIEVKTHCSGQHWVAVDNAASAAVNWSQIYIWDPGSSKDPTLDHTYTRNKKVCRYNANTALCFKVNK